MVHPINEDIFLVPRWPTNLFATVATPEHVVQAYNQIYGPGGLTPLPGVTEPLAYEQILDIDTDVAVVHLLSGSPYPHYFHISNFYEYAPGRSLLFDWTSALLTKYARYMNEPLLSYKNDEFGDYVRTRTEFLQNDVTGVWNRATGQVSISSAASGPVFLTGASLGPGSSTTAYNGRNISMRRFAAGETVTINVGDVPPVDPTTHKVALTVAGEGFGIVYGSPAGTVCLRECTAELEDGTVLTIAPLPLLGSRFDGFSGACQGAAFNVIVTRDLQIGATFGFDDARGD